MSRVRLPDGVFNGSHMNFTRISTVLNGLLGAVAMASVLAAASVFAQDDGKQAAAADSLSPSALLMRYPAGSISSVEQAERAVAEVDKARAQIEAQFAADQRACYEKFFSNECIDKAKERRQHALAQVRPIEVETNAFQRRERVVERDRALTERNAKREQEEAQRMKQQRENEAIAAKKSEDRARKAAQVEANTRNADPSKRQAQHDAKLRRIEAQERADAQMRADNTAAYERKVKEAEAHRREVEARKKEKEQERAARESPLLK